MNRLMICGEGGDKAGAHRAPASPRGTCRQILGPLCAADGAWPWLEEAEGARPEPHGVPLPQKNPTGSTATSSRCRPLGMGGVHLHLMEETP